MAELAGNRAIEDAAVKWVMELERAAGRQPQDTRHKGAAADVESPPRVIEVKAFGTSNRGYDLWLETRQVKEARENPNFYVYVVENVRQGDPTLFYSASARRRSPPGSSDPRQGNNATSRFHGQSRTTTVVPRASIMEVDKCLNAHRS